MFQKAQNDLTQSTTSGRPYPLNEVGCLPYGYTLTAKDFPYLLRDALAGVGGGRGGCATDAFDALLGGSSSEQKQQMTPIIVEAITKQMQKAHNIIDQAPEREIQYKELIDQQGIGYQIRDLVIDTPENTTSANKMLDHALGVLRPVAFHASQFINNDTSLGRLLLLTLVRESVLPDVREKAGYYYEDIVKRNPSALTAPQRGQTQGHKPQPKSPQI